MDIFNTDSLAYTFNQALLFHSFFAVLMVLPYIWNLFVFYTYKTFLRMNQKIFFIMPLTIFLLSVNFFTGIFLHSMMVFNFGYKIYLMLLVVIIFFAGEMIRLIKLKSARTSKEGMEKYVLFCKKMYFAFIIIYILLLFISYRF